MGLFLHVIVGYAISLFRMAARTLRAQRTKTWRETTATVVGASCQMSSFLPRPVAEIVYTYRVDGRFYGAADEKPFFLEGSAKEYVNLFAKGDNLIVRVKPGEPEVSTLRDGDQKRHAQ
jgi:hypothetical protein